MSMNSLDQFAGFSALTLTALLVLSTSRRLDGVLLLLLFAVWFAWQIERSATS